MHPDMEPVWEQLGRGMQGAEAHRCGKAYYLNPEEWLRAGVVPLAAESTRHLWEDVTEALVQCSRGLFSEGGGQCLLSETDQTLG